MKQSDKILLVDDSPDNLKLLTAILGEQYELIYATSGEMALTLVNDFKPDLIILDIMMPGIDGYETCRRLRRNAELCHAKIILISAKSDTEDRLEGYRAGADDYIARPFDHDELLAKVRVFLRLKFVEELNVLKTDLLTLLNHETRTPITGIMGAMQIFGMEGDLKEQDRQELINIAVKNCDRLVSLLNKSMLLCELQSGLRTLTKDCVELGALMNHALQKHQKFAGERKVQVVVEEAKETCVEGDAGFLTFLADAILHNAIRFSFPEEVVRVNIREEAGRVELVVTNNGPGIKRSYLPYVFQAFIPQDIDHHSDGHGLSLAVCREIIQAHGGQISVESDPGKSTCFSVSLPALPVDSFSQKPINTAELQPVG